MFVDEAEARVVCPALDWNVPPIVTLPDEEAELSEANPETSSRVVEAFKAIQLVEETRPDGARIWKKFWPLEEATRKRSPVWLVTACTRTVVEAACVPWK